MKNRILVLAPFGRDAQVITDVLRVGEVHTHVCQDGAELLEQLRQDSAATFVTEEMLGAELNDALRSFLADQPPWSDYPFVVLAARQTVRRTERARLVLQDLSNVVLIETVQRYWDSRRSPLFERLVGYFETEKSWRSAIDEHEAILTAIRNRDPAAARDAMHAHMDKHHTRFTVSWTKAQARKK